VVGHPTPEWQRLYKSPEQELASPSFGQTYFDRSIMGNFSRIIASTLASAVVVVIALFAGASLVDPLLSLPIAILCLFAWSYYAGQRFTRTMAVILTVAWLLIFGDAMLFGPYSRMYCRDLERRASVRQLVGKDESSIIPVLGRPSFIYELVGPTDLSGNPKPNARKRTCYNFAPFNSRLSTRFQVFCENGVVVAIDPADD
jgi:hypothetical protein